jgi:hypothetical protein
LRPAFIFPSVDRKGAWSEFGFIAVGIHTGGPSSQFLGL